MANNGLMGSSPRVIRHNRDTRAAPRVFCPAVHGLAYSFVAGAHLTPPRAHIVSCNENPSSPSAAKEPLCPKTTETHSSSNTYTHGVYRCSAACKLSPLPFYIYRWCRRRNPFKGRCQRSSSAGQSFVKSVVTRTVCVQI